MCYYVVSSLLNLINRKETLKWEHCLSVALKLQEKNKAIAAEEAASKRELKRLQSQLDDALEECDRLQSLIEEPDDAEALEDVECAVPLPDKGVCMVGGHPDLVSKVRKLYPKWKYVPVGSYPDSYGDCEVIIVATQSIPHKQYWHVKYNAGKSQRLLCTHKRDWPRL